MASCRASRAAVATALNGATAVICPESGGGSPRVTSVPLAPLAVLGSGCDRRRCSRRKTAHVVRGFYVRTPLASARAPCCWLVSHRGVDRGCPGHLDRR